MQFSERNKLISGAFAEAGADAKNTQAVKHQIGRLGRQAKTVPGMLMIRHWKEREWEDYCAYLLHTDALECLSFVQNPSTALSAEETDKYYVCNSEGRGREHRKSLQLL